MSYSSYSYSRRSRSSCNHSRSCSCRNCYSYSYSYNCNRRYCYSRIRSSIRKYPALWRTRSRSRRSEKSCFGSCNSCKILLVCFITGYSTEYAAAPRGERPYVSGAPPVFKGALSIFHTPVKKPGVFLCIRAKNKFDLYLIRQTNYNVIVKEVLSSERGTFQ